MSISSNAATLPGKKTGKYRRPSLPRFHGRYLLEERLGIGGMGVVYRGFRLSGGPAVAVKVLSEHLLGRDGATRFRREIEALIELDHANVVRLLDHGWVESRPFYVMELVEGPDLTKLISLDGGQPAGRVVSVTRQLACALSYAHGRGLVHRDIKPSNVILGYDDEHGEVAKLLDFGLVLPRRHIGERLTAEDMLIGTPGYIAPEGAKSAHALDVRSDLYALALIAFHLRTGKHLFKPVDAVCEDAHKKALERGWRVLHEAGGLPAPLENMLWRCLRFDPTRRPKDTSDLLRVLEPLTGWDRDDAAKWWKAYREER